MSYFMDCQNALLALAVANLNNNIAAACANNGIPWTTVDFTPGNGYYVAEDYDTADIYLGTEVDLPCLGIYLDTAVNLAGSKNGMMGVSFSGPVQFCIDMHFGSEQNDSTVLTAMKLSIAEGVFETFDAFTGPPVTWNQYQVAYSRGMKMQAHPSMFLNSNQFQGYQGVDIWLMRLSFAARFNLIRN